MLSASLPGSVMWPGIERQGLRRDLLVELDVGLELLGHGAAEGLGLMLLAVVLVEDGGLGLVEVLRADEAGDGGALLALDQHLDGAVGQFQQLQHGGHDADVIDGVRGRIVVGAVLLGGQQEICLSPRITSSRARTDFSRPTNSGTTIWGNTTMSRSGNTGSVRSSDIYLFSCPRPDNRRRGVPVPLRTVRLRR